MPKSLFDKVAGLRLKKETLAKMFFMNFAKFLKAHFYGSTPVAPSESYFNLQRSIYDPVKHDAGLKKSWFAVTLH